MLSISLRFSSSSAAACLHLDQLLCCPEWVLTTEAAVGDRMARVAGPAEIQQKYAQYQMNPEYDPE